MKKIFLLFLVFCVAVNVYAQANNSQDYNNYTGSITSGLTKIYDVTPAAGDLAPGITRAVKLSADDTITVEMKDQPGETVSVFLGGGYWHAMRIRKITAVAGSATVQSGY